MNFYSKENAIPIPDFLGQASEDQALIKLLPLLEEIRRSEDVRPVLRQVRQFKAFLNLCSDSTL